MLFLNLYICNFFFLVLCSFIIYSYVLHIWYILIALFVNFLYCLYSVVFLRLSVFWRLFHISFEFLHIFVIFLYFFILSTIFYNIFILIMLKLYKAKESIYFSSSFADKNFISRKYLCFISFCIDTFAFILLFVFYFLYSCRLKIFIICQISSYLEYVLLPYHYRPN